MAEKLHEATKRLLGACSRHIPLATIARETGLKPAWLSAFSRGAIPDPGVNKVQALFDYLIVPRPPHNLKLKVGELRDKLPHWRDLKQQHSVYFIFAANECIYVGKTNNIRSRLLGHNKLALFIECGFTHVEVCFFDTDGQAHEYEADRIDKLKPKLNTAKTGRPCAKPII